MKTLTQTATPVVTSGPGLVARIRTRIAAVLLTVAFAVMGSVGVAHATPVDDPTGGAGTQFIDDLKEWVTTYGVPLIFGLLLLGIVIKVALKYAKRGAKSV